MIACSQPLPFLQHHSSTSGALLLWRNILLLTVLGYSKHLLPPRVLVFISAFTKPSAARGHIENPKSVPSWTSVRETGVKPRPSSFWLARSAFVLAKLDKMWKAWTKGILKPWFKLFTRCASWVNVKSNPFPIIVLDFWIFSWRDCIWALQLSGKLKQSSLQNGASLDV